MVGSGALACLLAAGWLTDWRRPNSAALRAASACAAADATFARPGAPGSSWKWKKKRQRRPQRRKQTDGVGAKQKRARKLISRREFGRAGTGAPVCASHWRAKWFFSIRLFTLFVCLRVRSFVRSRACRIIAPSASAIGPAALLAAASQTRPKHPPPPPSSSSPKAPPPLAARAAGAIISHQPAAICHRGAQVPIQWATCCGRAREQVCRLCNEFGRSGSLSNLGQHQWREQKCGEKLIARGDGAKRKMSPGEWNALGRLAKVSPARPVAPNVPRNVAGTHTNTLGGRDKALTSDAR